MKTKLTMTASDLTAWQDKDFIPDWNSIDVVIIAFSGGKDSLACLLLLIKMGCPTSKIELWHHDIDGHENNGSFMDWKVTPSYCKAVAKAFGLPIYFSWREGGFLKEMTKQNTMDTSPVLFETPTGMGTNKPRGSKQAQTRMKFPQMSGDLSVRWCSGALKIDVAAAAISNQERFDGKRILMVTGERAEESSGRAKYARAEHHKTSNQTRETIQWRPVHHLTTTEVWALIAEFKVNPHPAYRMGWGRCSCACCIFGNAHQWASLRKVEPEKFSKVVEFEKIFSEFHGKTINLRRDGKDIETFANAGKAYDMNEKDMAAARSTSFDEPIFLDNWEMPLGANAELDGPC